MERVDAENQASISDHLQDRRMIAERQFPAPPPATMEDLQLNAGLDPPPLQEESDAGLTVIVVEDICEVVASAFASSCQPAKFARLVESQVAALRGVVYQLAGALGPPRAL